MTFIPNREFFFEVDKGHVPNHTNYHISGSNQSVGTTIVPVTNTGFYRTPTTATALEIVSSNANDTAAGTGARTVLVTYINSLGVLATQTVTMNGTTAVALATNCLRVLSIEVATAGSYGSQTTGSHVGTITLREPGPGNTWAQIGFNGAGFPLGKSQIACYTVPTGYTAYILSVNHSVDSTKTVNLYFFNRQGILTTSAPFTPVICRNAYDGITGFSELIHVTREKYLENTDFGFMAVVASGTCAVSVEIEICLVKN